MNAVIQEPANRLGATFPKKNGNNLESFPEKQVGNEL
jgi:hypothetical protein